MVKSSELDRSRHSTRMRITLGVLLAGLSLAGITARPQPQNPFEGLAMGAMSLAGTIAETFQDGAAINRDMNIDNPLMSVHSKTKMGYGDAMRPPSADSSEEEDRRRRRRRRRRSLGHLIRLKRAPCWKMTMTTAATPDDDEVEARRKRARKRAANNASRSRVSPTTKKKLHRRRRQTDTGMAMGSGSGMASGMGMGTDGPQQPGLADRVKGMWFAFVDNVTDVVQQMRQKINDATSSSGSGSGSGSG